MPNDIPSSEFDMDNVALCRRCGTMKYLNAYGLCGRCNDTPESEPGILALPEDEQIALFEKAADKSSKRQAAMMAGDDFETIVAAELEEYFGPGKHVAFMSKVIAQHHNADVARAVRDFAQRLASSRNWPIDLEAESVKWEAE